MSEQADAYEKVQKDLKEYVDNSIGKLRAAIKESFDNVAFEMEVLTDMVKDGTVDVKKTTVNIKRLAKATAALGVKIESVIPGDDEDGAE